MKKILDCEDNYISRVHLGEDHKLGINFPNSTSGHFLYTFYSYNHNETLHTSRIDTHGTAHNQIRKSFDTYAGYTDQEQLTDKVHIEHSHKNDFLSHYYNYNLTRKNYPNHFLIGITISPELILLHTYMMVFKVMKASKPDEYKHLLNQPLDVQYTKYENFFNHLNNYRYCDLDLTYTTKELYYDKTANPRLKKYRLFQRQYVDKYLDLFKKLQDYMSPHFAYQYKFEKEFIDKYRETLYI